MTGRALPVLWACSILSGCFLPGEPRAPQQDARIAQDEARDDGELDRLDTPAEMPGADAGPDVTPDAQLEGPMDDPPWDAAGDAPDDSFDDSLDAPEVDAQPDGPTDRAPPDGDASATDGAKPSAGVCTATDIGVGNVTPGCPAQTCSNVSCRRDANGGLLMSYDIDCGTSDRTWALCNFAPGHDFTDFDLAYGASGVIEVVFCVEGAPLRGEINLWYGRHPMRKILRLVRKGESLAPSCYSRYFSPGQVRFPGWTEIPPNCRERCGDVGPTCLAEFRVALDEARMDGGASYDFHSTGMQLAAENCEGATSGTLRLSWVKHLSDGCGCSATDACVGADRPTCRPVIPSDCPLPAGAPPGMCGLKSIGCTGPPGAAVPCAVTVGGKVCEGVTECVDGQYVCPASDCN